MVAESDFRSVVLGRQDAVGIRVVVEDGRKARAALDGDREGVHGADDEVQESEAMQRMGWRKGKRTDRK